MAQQINSNKWIYGKFKLEITDLTGSAYDKIEVYRVLPESWTVMKFPILRNSNGDWISEHKNPPPSVQLDEERKKLIKDASLGWYYPVKEVCRWLLALKYLVYWKYLIGIEPHLLYDIWKHTADVFGQYVAWDMVKKSPKMALACCLFNNDEQPMPIYKTGADFAKSFKHNVVGRWYYHNNQFCLCCWRKIKHPVRDWGKKKVICRSCLEVGEPVKCSQCKSDYIRFRLKGTLFVNNRCAGCQGRLHLHYGNLTVEEFTNYKNNHGFELLNYRFLSMNVLFFIKAQKIELLSSTQFVHIQLL